EQLYIGRATVLDATTQPGYAGQPLIRINCNKFASGFTIVPAGSGLPGGAGSTLKGFRIINYSSNAITVFKGADGNTIADNHIGFAPLGGGTYFKNTSVAPQCRGIGLESASNVIHGNTISGVDNGITLAGDLSSTPAMPCRNNTIDHNFIGTDSTGTIKIGNDSDGIFLAAGAQDNLIGPGNVLSGMASSGVELLDPTATGNIIFGNIIGLNAAGTAVIGNDELGVLIANGAANNSVGGPYGGAYPGNVISGNALGGVVIGTAAYPGASGSKNNRVEGNFVGTDGSGSSALGTQGNGIDVQFGAKGNVVRKNVVVGCSSHGIVLSQANSNALYGNWIGMTNAGTLIANNGFGVYVVDSSNNTIQVPPSSAGPGTEQNFFGINTTGRVQISGNSSGNINDASSPPPPTSATTFYNISTRARVGAGDNAVIGGFQVRGAGEKRVLIRAIGPSLTAFGLQDALPNPTIAIFRGQTQIASNDDWASSADAQAIVTTGLAPGSPLEAAAILSLPEGDYTAIVNGVGPTVEGTALVEVYDLDASSTAKLVNISTRAVVGVDDDIVIGGIIIHGQGTQTVVIRGIGPSLTQFGVSGALGDPTLRIANANGETIGVSDDWANGLSAPEITALGRAPSKAQEAALVTNLAPGNYTALLSGVGRTTGVALIEAYKIN
ncbi:MAG: hypothetical protein ACJ8I9_03555, partial [Chthoniobacterales bacterium]